MTIYIITDLEYRHHRYYTSITACLLDPENPIKIKNRRWSQIIKEIGYPFEHSGCHIQKVTAKSIKDVKGSCDNQ